jgi:hypothetical protein
MNFTEKQDLEKLIELSSPNKPSPYADWCREDFEAELLKLNDRILNLLRRLQARCREGDDMRVEFARLRAYIHAAEYRNFPQAVADAGKYQP